MTELLETARQHMAADGAAALSLRAVARDLGMVSSAVYRYVSSRDELLTLLIVGAYDAVGLVAEQADRDAAAAGGGAGTRWLQVCRAVRKWAIAHPQEYALIYGSPVPGYRAPTDTVAPAIRIWRVILGVIDTAIATGTLRPPARPFDITGLVTDDVTAVAGDLPSPPFDDAIVRGVGLFASLFGAISTDLFGHYKGFAHDTDRLFDLIIATCAEGAGLDLPVDVGR